MSINRKRGSIALARQLCYQINGAADDSDDIDGGGYGSVDIAEILSAEVVRLQEALAQEQEPVADDFFKMIADKNPKPFTLPQRTWVGLTKKEVHDLYDSDYVVFHQRIEAKLKDKNS